MDFQWPGSDFRQISPHAVQLGHILRMKVIEIRHVGDQPVFHQLGHHRRAEASMSMASRLAKWVMFR